MNNGIEVALLLIHVISQVFHVSNSNRRNKRKARLFLENRKSLFLYSCVINHDDIIWPADRTLKQDSKTFFTSKILLQFSQKLLNVM